MYRLLILALFVLPYAYAFSAESIPSFDARIEVFEDATLMVQERITYDFGEEDKHGIFRVIPYSYQAETTTYTAPISEIFVFDGNSEPIPFAESRGKGELTLKIGDPEKTVTGEQQYVISYRVNGPFLFFPNQDELYWNVTGVWQKPIKKASVLIDLPKGAIVLDATCYQGGDGAVGACTESERLVNTERAGYRASADNLNADEQLTIAVAFPKGTIVAPVTQKPEARHAPWYVYPLFSLPIWTLLFVGWLWYTRGRDPRGRGTIITQFTPPAGVSPAVAGIVYNERIEPREITAEIVRLAVDGHIKIHRIEKKVFIVSVTDYLFERIDTMTPSDEIQSFILQKLFQDKYRGTEYVHGKEIVGTLLSNMQHAFVSERDAIIDLLYQTVLQNGYFPERPDHVRRRYYGIGVGIVVLGMLAFMSPLGAGNNLYGFLAIGAMCLSGAIFIGAGFFMPVKTREGVLLREHLEGFKRYLAVAEKDRLAFQNAPERTPELFDTYLPYAMAFGVELAWAKQFEGIYLHEPSWHSGAVGTYSGALLAQEMRTFGVDFTSASMPASSSASGGGHAGGGFGGGGGGSW